jgi:hypothetical protein
MSSIEVGWFTPSWRTTDRRLGPAAGLRCSAAPGRPLDRSGAMGEGVEAAPASALDVDQRSCDRGAAALADNRRADRQAPGDAALDGVGDPAADRARQALAAGAARAAEPLSAPPSGRAEQCRRQSWRGSSAGPVTGSPATVAPASAPVAPAGSTCMSRSRRHPAGVRGGPGRREGRHRSQLPAPRAGVLPPPRRPRRARDDRQRLRLPLGRARHRLPRARAAPPTHAALPAAHQRQSRALHPHHARRVGLRRHLRQLPAAHRRPVRLARALQLPATTRRPQPPAPGQPTTPTDRNNLLGSYIRPQIPNVRVYSGQSVASARRA